MSVAIFGWVRIRHTAGAAYSAVRELLGNRRRVWEHQLDRLTDLLG